MAGFMGMDEANADFGRPCKMCGLSISNFKILHQESEFSRMHWSDEKFEVVR